MTRSIRTGTLGAVLIVFASAMPASADPIVFDFNSLADGKSNSYVQTYMQNVLFDALGLANAVTVTGAKAEKNYTGDNHVVGPVSGTTVTSLTLGNSDQVSNTRYPGTRTSSTATISRSRCCSPSRSTA